jgi:hypothetical protein
MGARRRLIWQAVPLLGLVVLMAVVSAALPAVGIRAKND